MMGDKEGNDYMEGKSLMSEERKNQFVIME